MASKLDLSPETLLRWYLEAGVDEAILDLAHQRPKRQENALRFPQEGRRGGPGRRRGCQRLPWPALR